MLPTLVFGRRRLRTADALILVGLTVMAWQAIRFLLIVGPIGAAIVAVVLSPVISDHGLRPAHAPDPRSARRGRGPAGGAPSTLVLDRPAGAVGVGVSLLRVVPADPGRGDRARPAGWGRGLDG